MSRLFESKGLNYTNRENDEVLDKKGKIHVAFEGNVTEPKYFERLGQQINSQNKVIEIVPVIRRRSDGKSHPYNVRDGIKEYFNKGVSKYFDSKIDHLWIIIDIDNHFGTERVKERNYIKYLNSLEIKHSNNDEQITIPINVGVTNPCFELWLLLHYVDFTKEMLNNINKKPYERKSSFVKSTLYPNNKSKDIILHDNILEAKRRSENKLLEQQLEKLIHHPGTTLNELMDLIFDS